MAETRLNKISDAVEAQTDDLMVVLDGLHDLAEQGTIERVSRPEFPRDGDLQPRDMCFYQVEQLSFDQEYPHREAFENVILSLGDPNFNFVYVLTGTQTGIDLHVGVVKNNSADGAMSAVNYGEIVAKLFEGNFNGSILRKLQGNALQDKMLAATQKYTDAGLILGIPSVQDSTADAGSDFQGIDRLVNSMLGQEWRLVVVCEPVHRTEIRRLQDEAYDIYNRLSLMSKQTMQTSVNSGSTTSAARSESETKGKTTGTSWSKSGSETTDGGYKTSHTKQTQEGEHTDRSSSRTEGSTKTDGQSVGTSQSMTVEVTNKRVQELLKYIDEELLQRLGSGFSRGLFKTSVYYMANGPKAARQLKNGVVSLFQGSQMTRSPLRARELVLDTEHLFNRKVLNSYQNWSIADRSHVRDALTLSGIPVDGDLIGLSTYLTPGEVSLLAGLPHREVPGLPMKEAVSFGLNVSPIDRNDAIDMGQIVQRGRDLPGCRFSIGKKELPKHVFVAGVTGSGKTTTCQKLLREAGTPFWVIEPAKTEYRALLKSRDDLVVFTLGNESIAPFRINPFELVEGEVISSHIDMVKATFTSAFPMEASMPQLLEEAMCQSYERLGWDVASVYHAADYTNRRFPTLSDLLAEMGNVVEKKGFSDRLKGDYIGSLVSRLSNLTKGVKGKMLDCERSTDFEGLIQNHRSVVLELEELRSAEDKALFMGFILARLTAVIRQQHRQDRHFSHITLVEEAHRLLSKVDYTDSGAKKAAVETFSDMLAEVRKYGEGLIIVDQIPNKLAPDVLKNTNTKIIHRLLARDDKDAVGDTMSMDAKQKEFLSLLPVGDAIVFSEQTDTPVHITVDAPMFDPYSTETTDEEVARAFEQRREELGSCYGLTEGVDRLLSTFNKVRRALGNMEVNEDECRSLRESVAGVAKDYGATEEQAWAELVTLHDRRIGKLAHNDQEKNMQRIRALTEFFAGDFCRGDFSKSIFADIAMASSRLIAYMQC